VSFYVTVRDQPTVGGRDLPGRVGWLAGPFRRHGDAVRAVTAAKRTARDVDPKAHWYAFGTARRAADHDKLGVLNDRMGLQLDADGYVTVDDG
jgi:hypothetical protein